MGVKKYLACLHCKEYILVGAGTRLYLMDGYQYEIEDFLFRGHSGPGHSLVCVDEVLLQKLDHQAIMSSSDGQVH